MESTDLELSDWPWAPRSYASPEGRMHFVDVGRGSPVLFAHGTPTWAYEWRHLIQGLSPHARCIAVDHLGFGRSARPNDADYTPEAHAARFAAFADHLDLHDVTVVLHDYGGPIGLPWVLDHLNRVQRLVVINTWAWPLDEARYTWPARILGTPLGRLLYGYANVSLDVLAASAWADPGAWRAVRDAYRSVFPDPASRMQVLWPLARALRTSRPFYAELEARLPSLAGVPVSVVWGVHDSAFPTPVRDRWLHAVPHAERVDIEGGHWPHEEGPEAILAHVKSALSEPAR